MKKIDKRLLILNICVIVVIIFSFVYVCSVGDDYTLHTYIFGEMGQPDAVVDVADDDVVEFVNLRTEGDELVVDFRAGDKGETKVSVSYIINGAKRDPVEYEFEVNEFGTLVDHTWGNVRFNGDKVVIVSIIFLLALTEFIMLWMFVDYRKNGRFSYPMIACGGISIFNGILLAYVGYYLFNWSMVSFSYFLSQVIMAGIIMLVLLIPPMLVLSLLMAISNLWLMRHEGARPVNALGIFFAVIWFIGTLCTVGVYMIPKLGSVPLNRYLILPLVYIIGYFECMFISTVACSFLAAKYKAPLDRDYIIILGCAIRADGSLTPLLKGRVDSAIAFEKEQYDKTGKHAVFVPSGGQGADEVIAEGEAMERYLTDSGVPKEQIVKEDKSVNTFENMKFSKAVIDGHSSDKEKKIAFATTNYHVFRGYIMAKKNGFDAKGISAKTKLYFFPNAFLREFIGLLVDQKWRHLLFIIVIEAFFFIIERFIL